MFSVFILLLALLSRASCSCLGEPELHGEFSGLKRGFLNTPSKKPMAVAVLPKKQPEIDERKAVVPYSSARSPNLPIWADPALKTPKARESIYDFLRGSLGKNSAYEPLFIGVEEYFKAIASSDISIRDTVLASTEASDYVELRALFFCQCKPNKLPENYNDSLIPNLLRIVASMDNQVLSAEFGFIQQLPEDKGKEILGKFATPDSNYERGQLPVKGAKGFLLGYFTESHPSGKRYRIYSLETSIPIAHSFFSRYSQALAKKGRYSFWPTDDFILDKQGGLVETPGIVIARTGLELNPATAQPWTFLELGPVSKDAFIPLFTIFIYQKDPTEHRMRLFPQSNFREEDIKSFPLEKLVSLAGGIETINRDKLTLIPEPHLDITVKDAEMLLPYALHLQFSLTEADSKENAIDVPLLTYAIGEMEKVILNSPFSQALIPLLEKQIAQELANKQIEKELKDKAKSLFMRIEEVSTAIAYAPPQRKKSSWGTKKKNNARREAHKAAIEKIKTERARAQDPIIVRQKAQEKLAEKIRKKYTDKALEMHHFSSSGACELLDDLTRAFSRRGLVVATGASRTRGSHVGKEVALPEGTGSVILGLARRPEAIGYEVGTVKTIINNRVDNIVSLLRRSHCKSLSSHINFS